MRGGSYRLEKCVGVVSRVMRRRRVGDPALLHGIVYYSNSGVNYPMVQTVKPWKIETRRNNEGYHANTTIEDVRAVCMHCF